MSAATETSETAALLNGTEQQNLRRAVSHGSMPGYGSMNGEEDETLAKEGAEFETTFKAESKLLVKYSMPLLLTYMLQYSYNLVTVFVAGKLGTKELGAASLASMTANITGLAVYEGLGTSLDTLTSQAYGGGKKKLVGIHLQRMVALVLVATIPIGALWICSPWILIRLVPQRDLAILAGDFMRIYLIGAPFFGMFEAGKRFTQAQGNFTASLIPVLVCAPLNILWNWLFAFKFGWGFQGAAAAVSLSNILQPIVLLVYVRFFAKYTLECWPGLSIKKSFQGWGPMVKLAIPSVVMTLSEWLAFDILTFTSSYLGEEYLAAQSVLITVGLVMYHIPLPFAIAGSTRFGNLIGNGAVKAARKAWNCYYLIFLGIGIFDIAILIGLRYPIANAFSSDNQVRDLIVGTIPIVAFMQMFDATTCLSNGLLRGMGRQKIGGWVNFAIYYVFGLPLSMLLVFGPPHLGLIGLWTGPTLGLVAATCVFFIYMKRANWQKCVEEAQSRT